MNHAGCRLRPVALQEEIPEGASPVVLIVDPATAASAGRSRLLQQWASAVTGLLLVTSDADDATPLPPAVQGFSCGGYFDIRTTDEELVLGIVRSVESTWRHSTIDSVLSKAPDGSPLNLSRDLIGSVWISPARLAQRAGVGRHALGRDFRATGFPTPKSTCNALNALLACSILAGGGIAPRLFAERLAQRDLRTVASVLRETTGKTLDEIGLATLDGSDFGDPDFWRDTIDF